MTQPDPRGGTGDVIADLLRYLPDDSPLLSLLAERRGLGIRTYGQPLRWGDGRDHRRDLLEELLDAAAYSHSLSRQGEPPSARTPGMAL